MSSRIFIFILPHLLFFGSAYSQIIGTYPDIDTLFTGGGCTISELYVTVLKGVDPMDTVRICPGWNTVFWTKKYNYIENIDILIRDSLHEYTIELWCEFADTVYCDHPFRIPFDTSFSIGWGYGDYSLELYLRKDTSVTRYTIQCRSSTFGYSIRETGNDLDKFHLYANFPNPFNPTTTIKFSVDKNEHTSLAIYDITGREVALLISEKLTPGTYSTCWDASAMPSGVYFCLLRSGSHSVSKKLIFMK